MDLIAIAERLASEYGYPAAGATRVAEKLVACAPDVQGAFETWWNTRMWPDLSVQGYSVGRLIKEHDMNVVAALLTLDWLQREPEKALASLRKGHDAVSRASAKRESR